MGLFIVLTVAAVVVFAVLPNWVETGRIETGRVETGHLETGAGSLLEAHPSSETLRSSEIPQSTETVPAENGLAEIRPAEIRPAEPRPAEALPKVTEAQSQAALMRPESNDPTRQSARRAAVSAAVESTERRMPQAPARNANRAVEETFRREMSTGLSALRDQDFVAAEEAFKRAAALRSTSAVEDGLAQAVAGSRRLRIAELQGQASRLEEQEAWRDAVERYQELLTLDATLAFARAGLARAKERAELAERLDFHLSNAARLASPAVLGEATETRDRALALEPSSPDLDRRAAELDRLITAYSRRVEAMIESDELTEVAIYQVARLGRFRQRQLALRPGTYTVVGSRSGYRDVRRQWVIPADGSPDRLTIRCEERL